MKPTIFFIVFLFYYTVSAQSENSLYFDGTNDVVTIHAASSYISSSASVSLSGWIYPTNTSPGFPNFDGIMGFRNDANADFYLLHLTATSLEARFRNSSGTHFTTTVPNIQLNTWQHLVMTYNGSSLKVYLNGSQAASISASGSISSSTENLYLGNLPFQTTNFQFGGKLDEIALWSKALTPAEVSCMYQHGHSTTDPALELFYKCDQGTANGNNASITKLIDSQVNKDGNLSGFTLNGSTSNFTNGMSIVSDVSGNICKGDSVAFGSSYYSQSGTYFTTVSAGSCDSIVRLTLTVDSADASAKWVNNNTELHANATNATYQWIDCDSRQALAGQTRQNYRPQAGGNYAVVVTQNGCTDTSSCFYTNIALNELKLTSFDIYPNPSSGTITFSQSTDLQDGILIISTLAGKVIEKIDVKPQPETSIELNLPAGLYALRFLTADGRTATTSLMVKY